LKYILVVFLYLHIPGRKQNDINNRNVIVDEHTPALHCRTRVRSSIFFNTRESEKVHVFHSAWPSFDGI